MYDLMQNDYFIEVLMDFYKFWLIICLQIKKTARYKH